MLRFGKLVLGMAVALCASTAAAGDTSPVDLINKGRADEAIRTLSQQNTSAENYHLLCRAYYAVQDYDNAIRNGERAVQMNGNVARYYLWLGRAYGSKAENAGPFAAFSLARKTVAAFEKSLSLDPGDWRTRRDLAEYYIEAPGIVGGGKDKARRLADDVQSKDSATAAWIRASIAMEEKNNSEAEKQFKAAVTASGNQPSMMLELARFYRRSQQWQQFDDTVKQFMAAPKRVDRICSTPARCCCVRIATCPWRWNRCVSILNREAPTNMGRHSRLTT